VEYEEEVKELGRKYKDYHKTIDGVEYKQCKDCLEWFVMDNNNFSIVNKNKDKFNMSCKKCLAIYNNNIYMNDRENRIEQAKKWKTDNPERQKILQQRVELKPERIKYLRKRHKEEREKGYNAEYNKRADVKARHYGRNHRIHEISTQEWIDCKNYFKDEDKDQSCAYCGKKIQDHLIMLKGELVKSDFHKEHVDDKGYNDVRNCIPSCRDCNSHKWLFNFEDWYREQEFFVEARYDKIISWITYDYKLYIKERPLYRIIKKKNEFDNKFHQELWSVDEKRNIVKCLDKAQTRKDLDISLIYK